MGELTTQARAAVEAVARHVSATWEPEEGDGPAAWLEIAGRRIAVDVAAIACERGATEKPRLRLDRVVLRLLAGLNAALSETIPDGTAAIVTVTAPIRLPAKTEAAIGGRVRARLAGRETIHGNAVRIRFVEGVPASMPRMVGFVHTPGSDADVLLDLAESLLRRVGAAEARRLPADFSGARWLVVADEGGQRLVEAYRDVCAQLSVTTVFERVLIVLAGSRVEALAGPDA